MDSVGFCYLDRSVSMKCSSSLPDELVDISLLEESPAPEEIYLEIKVNEKIFQRKKGFLSSDFLRHVLEQFNLVDQSTVTSEDMEDFGISEVLISSKTKGAFSINRNTKLLLRNVSLKIHQSCLFNELGGVQQSFNELVKLPINLKLQNKCQTALIVGPTGCGKTSICHNFFVDQKANVFCFQAAELFRQYPGETEEVLRNIFQNARQFVKDFNPKDPTVIFLENIDVICPAEETANSARITAQFVSLLDNLYSGREKLLVIATTNNAEAVDHSLKRNGRFNSEVVIRALDEHGRKEVLKIVCKRSLGEVSKEVIEYVVKKTPGYVGADLCLLVENVLKESSKGGEVGNIFEKALKNVSIFMYLSSHGTSLAYVCL